MQSPLLYKEKVMANSRRSGPYWDMEMPNPPPSNPITFDRMLTSHEEAEKVLTWDIDKLDPSYHETMSSRVRRGEEYSFWNQPYGALPPLLPISIPHIWGVPITRTPPRLKVNPMGKGEFTLIEL